MARRGHQARWVFYIIFNMYIITNRETTAESVYTSVTGNGNDALIVSNEQVYMQRGQTQRIPCGKQTGGMSDVIATTWYKGDTKKEEIIRIVSDPIYGSNYTSPEYEGRASFTQGFHLTLQGVVQMDSGRYRCEIIKAGGKVDYEVEVVVIDKTLPKRSAARSVSQLLQAGENILNCPVYKKSITRPTIYYSIQHDVRYPTDILVSRFSDGSVLSKDSTFDIQREANYSLVIKEPDTAPAELLIWCHVSSDVDGVNLMSGFINATRFKPTTSSTLVWIVPLVCSVVIIFILVCVAAAYYKQRWKTQSPPKKIDEETIPIKSQDPINNESCEDYGLKAEIDSGGKKKKSPLSASKDNFFSLRLVTVAGNGDIVTLDNKAIRVMTKEYKEKNTFLDEYVAIATSKRQAGKVLVARKSGNVSWLNIKDGTEVEIDGSRSETLREISDMDVDDEGIIYVADVANNKIYTYNLNGTFASSFAVIGSPKCISACEDGIVYVLSEGIIKKYKNGKREDYDIKCPTDVNIVTTGLYSSKNSVYVLTKSAESDEAEASAILEFSATDGHLERRIIDGWIGILGMVFIRGDDELGFFDSKEMKVYERKK